MALVGTLALALLVPSLALAADSTFEQQCRELYEIPERTINSNLERSHDPRLFFIRRCINNLRQNQTRERLSEHETVREQLRNQRLAERGQALKAKQRSSVTKAIRRSNFRGFRTRTRVHVLNARQYRQDRATRRSIVRTAEGVDRINAVRRKLYQNKLPDPCLSVGVIRKRQSPCKVERGRNRAVPIRSEQ